MRALLIAALIALAGCELDEPLAWGTVVSVQEKEVLESPDDTGKHYEPPLLPEVAWKVEVLLDDGVTITRETASRYEPGERVRVLIPVSHALPQE